MEEIEKRIELVLRKKKKRKKLRADTSKIRKKKWQCCYMDPDCKKRAVSVIKIGGVRFRYCEKHFRLVLKKIIRIIKSYKESKRSSK